MLLLISPAKTLDYETPTTVRSRGEPHFMAQAAGLIDLLKPQTPAQIAALMDLSDPLAALNVGRYAAWSPRSTRRNSRAAVLAFAGDVYTGLDAPSLAAADLAWAQDHLVILSGLYGVLKPLDPLQPYRLEMGTRLANPQGKDLYAYWRAQIAAYLNDRQAGKRQPVVVNLASQEYFKAVDRRVLAARVVECVFEDCKAGQWKVISFWAKRARGAMARFVIQQRLREVDGLKAFDADGYIFDAAASEPDRWVFRRRHTPVAA
ncbi:MAG: peroxide stress protein YaaA [Burkholderiales bacterium]